MNRLKEARGLVDLKQAEFARDMEFNTQTIKEIESGRQKNIPPKLAVRMSRKYGFNLEWLLGESDEIWSIKQETLKDNYNITDEHVTLIVILAKSIVDYMSHKI